MLSPVTDVMASLQDAVLEVRDVESLREHHPLTLRAWVANLVARRSEAVAEVGARRERVWRRARPPSPGRAAVWCADGLIVTMRVCRLACWSAMNRSPRS